MSADAADGAVVEATGSMASPAESHSAAEHIGEPTAEPIAGPNVVEPIAEPIDSVPLQIILPFTNAAYTIMPQDTTPSRNSAIDAIDTNPSINDGSQPTGSATDAPGGQSIKHAGVPGNPPQPRGKETNDEAAEMAISPVNEHIIGAAPEPDGPPVCNITLLLTTGRRYPFKIDAKYLSQREVFIPEETPYGQPSPFSISVYTLKQLILREWRGDWEARPASPSSIRLIHFGKLLDDKDQLKKYQFCSDTPNVVHMSIRPHDLDEDETKTGGKSLGGGGDGSRSRNGRGCCVVL